MANRILSQNSNRIVTQNGLYYIDYNLSPISAGTECFICEICDDISTKITPPHPFWTNNYGKILNIKNNKQKID